MEYCITPFLAWLVAGCSKFAINTLKAGKLDFKNIGYGGLPSNHSAIVSSMAALIALREGIDEPAFGVALTLAFIVMLDANSLRLKIGKQAEAINALYQERADKANLRERMGHTRVEIAAGVLVGCLVAYLVDYLILTGMFS
jgi:hypothetical protein